MPIPQNKTARGTIGAIEHAVAACAGALTTFVKDRRGVSAIEFAFIFPVMITVYLGAVEITQLLSVDRKVTNLASTVADLIAQAEQIDDNGIQVVFDASSTILAPFNTAGVSIVVSSVSADADNNTTVTWSDARNGTARTPGSAIVLPRGVIEPNSSLIVSEVTYVYTSFVGEIVRGPATLKDKFYVRPRYVNEVQRN